MIDLLKMVQMAILVHSLEAVRIQLRMEMVNNKERMMITIMRNR